ncbi:hypothetical protein Taro_036570 [Colocasia esculenta]|uniref:Uncharacterized protein ycf33 n=1 Tax=Colocasia esculenta TaxID=4460 RepID=A0A843WA65_COLES|nr:hypothetical protein [Colocasia esculenta]
MKCCYSAPNLRPPLHHHHILPRQAATPHLHPITIPSSAAAAAATGRRRRIVLSSSIRALGRYTATTSCPVTSQAAAPEEEPCEGGALPSSTSSAASSDGYNTSSRTRRMALAAATLGVAAAVFMAGADGQEALALGPEGPLVEEFWDNVRRYGFYILTVSTGAIYTILQPIVELLKNPISAILLLVILGGSFYLLSQVLSFMVGINEFSYDYAN